MAFRLQKKARLMAVLGLTLMLSGCGAQLLSQREIVRAVFFDRSPEGYTAVLLLNDHQGEQDGDYKTASASGNTPALAWDSAANSLPGKAFYGLMDLAVLPPDCSWQEAQEIGALVEQTAQPAPEIAVYLLGTSEQTSSRDRAGDLYDTLHLQQKNLGLHCGLQTLFASDAACAVPVCAEEGYAFSFLSKDGRNVFCHEALSAQLAAVLTGEADRMDCVLESEEIRFRAGTNLAVQPDSADHAQVLLTLRECRLTDLKGQNRGEEEMGAQLEQALQNAFVRIENQLFDWEGDPLNLRFWAANRYGASNVPVRATLTVLRENAPEHS